MDPFWMFNSCWTSHRAQAWRRDRFRSKTGALPIGGHHGIRNARQYGLPISKLCFGTMTFGDGRGFFKAISTVDQAGGDELVKTLIDGGISQRHIVRKLIAALDPL